MPKHHVYDKPASVSLGDDGAAITISQSGNCLTATGTEKIREGVRFMRKWSKDLIGVLSSQPDWYLTRADAAEAIRKYFGFDVKSTDKAVNVPKRLSTLMDTFQATGKNIQGPLAFKVRPRVGDEGDEAKVRVVLPKGGASVDQAAQALKYQKKVDSGYRRTIEGSEAVTSEIKIIATTIHDGAPVVDVARTIYHECTHKFAGTEDVELQPGYGPVYFSGYYKTDASGENLVFTYPAKEPLILDKAGKRVDRELDEKDEEFLKGLTGNAQQAHAEVLRQKYEGALLTKFEPVPKNYPFFPFRPKDEFKIMKNADSYAWLLWHLFAPR